MHPTGFAALDAALPGGGWPRTGLIEVLIPCHGIGELQLFLPLLARLTHAQPARWAGLIAPPLEPYAPAFAAEGVDLERLLVVRTSKSMWALEQALGSGACEIALAWTRRGASRELRRLALASEHGRTPGVLFRPARAASESSPATLRLVLEPQRWGLRVSLLKSRGGARGHIHIPLHSPLTS